MDKIFQDYKDKNVAGVVLYTSASATKVFSDKLLTTEVTTSELRDAALKGAFVWTTTGDEGEFMYSAVIAYEETIDGNEKAIGQVTYYNSEGDLVGRVSVADPE